MIEADHTQAKFLWWGYLHIQGTLQAKRFFDQRDIDDALESPFVKQVVYPFLAADREEALNYIKQQTS